MGRRFSHIDPITSITLLLLSLFGIGILFTLDPSFGTQQIVYTGIGIGLLLTFSLVPAYIYESFAPFFYVGSIILLIITLFTPPIRGASRWIMVGTEQIQPSEVLKPFMLVAFAGLLVRFPPKTIGKVFFHCLLFLLPFLLIFKQPDLGSGIVYFAMWFVMMLAAGLPLRFVGIGAIAAGISSPIVWHFLASYQKDRLLTFINPSLDPTGTGYNAIQSMIAIGSGGFFGKGLGLGTQSSLRFLPEYHTDFIFASTIEELGFFGGALIFILFGVLLSRLVKPYLTGDLRDDSAFIYTSGVFAMMLIQVVVNSGMNMGILPITGITFPLLSFGGSSILSIYTAFGIAMAFLKRQGRVRGTIAVQ